jgi:intraflagellar transport protein 52
MQEYDAPDIAADPPSSRQQQQYAAGGSAGDATRVLFCSCKGETHTHKSGFKQLYRRLRSMYRPEKLDSQEDLCLEVLLGPGTSGLSSSMQGGLPFGGAAAPAILVLGCPTQPFTAAEFETLRAFLQAGGSLLVCMAEGGEARAGASTNINYLLEEHGIAVNSDAVVRTAHYKYLHPKEALISDGVLNRALLSAAAGGGKGSSRADNGPGVDDDTLQTGSGAAAEGFAGKGLDFVYPYGCTLSVQPPAVPILSTGKISYPMQRPLGEEALVVSRVPATASNNGYHAVVQDKVATTPLNSSCAVTRSAF